MTDKAEAAVGLYLQKPHREAFEAGGRSSNEMCLKAFLYYLLTEKGKGTVMFVVGERLER